MHCGAKILINHYIVIALLLTSNIIYTYLLTVLIKHKVILINKMIKMTY